MNTLEKILCSVNGCEKPAAAKGMCRAHYARFKRGTDLVKPLRVYAPGGICSVENCERVVQSRGMCKMHAKRDRIHGDPTIVKRGGPGFGKQHHAWLGDKISYDGAHYRVIRSRGSASAHPCTNCGKQANDWAYNHSDPNPLTEVVNGSLLQYSGDPIYYIPLCKACHLAGDAQYRASLKTSLAEPDRTPRDHPE